jgi:hypothetical protein
MRHVMLWGIAPLLCKDFVRLVVAMEMDKLLLTRMHREADLPELVPPVVVSTPVVVVIEAYQEAEVMHPESGRLPLPTPNRKFPQRLHLNF